MTRTIVKRHPISLLVAGLLFASLALSACQPGSVPIVSAGVQDYAGMRISAPNCSYGGNLRSIEALDRYTVRFTLCNTDPAFAAKIAFPVFAIQDASVLNSTHGDSAKLDALHNGSGAYRVKDWTPGESIVLEANPEYWGVPPKTKTIEFRWNTSSSERLAGLTGGTVDGVDRPASAEVEKMTGDENIVVLPRPALNTFYLGMNNTFAPFGDERVRQAFSMAIDRRALVDTLFMQGSEVAEQFLPSTLIPGYTPGYRWYDLNLKEAGDLLEESGFDANQVIPLSYSTGAKDYLPDPEAAAVAIKTQLEQAGIQVLLDPHPEDEFNRGLQQGAYALFLAGWVGDFPDASDFYNAHFAGSSKEFGNPYSDIVFMLKQAAREFDSRQRQSRYNRVNELIRIHAPAIPIAHSSTVLGFSTRVENVAVGPMNENFEEMTTADDRLVFMQSGEPRHIWPADENEMDALRISRLVYDTLLEYEFGGTAIRPALAEYYEANSNMTEWTFLLRYDVMFANGADLDANDVVASFGAQWNAADPNHSGDTGEFRYFQRFFGSFLNAQ